MKNNDTVYVVKVARSSKSQVGYEEDVIVFVTLSEEKADDFVDEYGVKEFMWVEEYTLDELPE